MTATTIKPPFATAADHDALVFGEVVCKWCNGERVLNHPDHTPYSCRCQSVQWKKRYIQQLLPMRYHRSNFWTLRPSEKSKMSLESQQKMIDFFKQHPDDGYFLFDAPGTSKTTFATALIRRALERDWKQHLYPGFPTSYTKTLWIRYINWDTLIQEYLDYQNHPDTAPEPSVTPRTIREARRNGKHPVLCIEEVDKSRLTEFKANKFFEFMVAIDETQGQLILTTNHLSLASFETWLYKTGNDAIDMAGEPAFRRIMDNCKAIECKAI